MGKIITVEFMDDTLFAVERDDGIFLALKPISDSLGLKWNGQFERVQRDPILAEGIRVIRIPSPGGTQDTTCLRLELVNGWLFTIDDSRIREENVREKVLTYKRECYSVLFHHFYGKARVAEIIEPPQQTEEAEPPKVRLVTEARHTFGVQAAGQLWFKLGLPVVPAMYHDPRQMELIDYSRIKSAEPGDQEAA